MSANDARPYQSVDSGDTTEGESVKQPLIGVERGPLGDGDGGREILIEIDAPGPIGERVVRITVDADGAVSYGHGREGDQ